MSRQLNAGDSDPKNALFTPEELAQARAYCSDCPNPDLFTPEELAQARRDLAPTDEALAKDGLTREDWAAMEAIEDRTHPTVVEQQALMNRHKGAPTLDDLHELYRGSTHTPQDGTVRTLVIVPMRENPEQPGEVHTLTRVSIRLLIVDDVEESRVAIAKILSFEPDIVLVGFAADGREALLAAEAEQPDLVLMDIEMPRMDGLVATELMTRERNHPPVIITTFIDDAKMLERIRAAGAAGYVVKPMSAGELVGAIHTVMSVPSNRATERGRFTLSDGTKVLLGESEVSGRPGAEAPQPTAEDLMAALRASVEAAKGKGRRDRETGAEETDLVGPAPSVPPEAASRGFQSPESPAARAARAEEIRSQRRGVAQTDTPSRLGTSQAPAESPSAREGSASASFKEPYDTPQLAPPTSGPGVGLALAVHFSWLVGLGTSVLVLFGVIQAYGSGPGILRGFVGGVISFFAELTGSALFMWLNFVGWGAALGFIFSLIGAARGRRRWFVPLLFALAALAATPTQGLIQGILDWLGGVSRWSDAAYWGAAIGVFFLMAITAPAFVRDLWRWCNGATFTALTARGLPFSLAWVAVPFVALGHGSELLSWLPVLAVIAVIAAVCGRG